MLVGICKKLGLFWYWMFFHRKRIGSFAQIMFFKIEANWLSISAIRIPYDLYFLLMNFSQDGILLIDRRINFSAHSTISKLWSILIDPSIGQPGHDRCDRLAVKSRSTSSTSTRRTSYFRKIPQPQEEDIHVSYIPGGKILKETNWNFRSLLFFQKEKEHPISSSTFFSKRYFA